MDWGRNHARGRARTESSRKGGPVTQRPRFALNHFQIVTPAIDDASGLVQALTNALVRANRMPFGYIDQPVGGDYHIMKNCGPEGQR